MAELKPCPFCGRKPSKVCVIKMTDLKRSFYMISCEAPLSKCGVKPSTALYETQERAIEAWNRRAGDGK